MAKRIRRIVKNLLAPQYARLNVLKLALAAGITLAILYLGTNVFLMIKTSQFSALILKSVSIGALYNFSAGFIGGLILAWTYNKLL